MTPRLEFPDPPLADDVVRLRPWTDADLADAHRATQDPLIPRYTHVPERQTLEDVRSWLGDREARRLAGDRLALVIVDAPDGTFLGSVSLLRFDWDAGSCEVGYYLASWARGRGVMTRAVGLLSRWALRELGIARLALVADLDNPASHRVAERCGFTREGVLRSFEERKGHRVDVVMFSLLPADLC